jgi:serine/threonine protein phosphatase 1
MSITDDSAPADGLAKDAKTGKFARWASPFFKAFAEMSSPVVTARCVPDGMRVYCVGDIHGRNDLLDKMAERITVDMADHTSEKTVTVFLGDYVDRGFGSMAVLERLSRSEWPTSTIALAGNHEDLLLKFIEDERTLEAWRGLGGLETLHSYGVSVGRGLARRDFKKIQATFKARFPEHHRHFLETLETSSAIGDYFFCHAGIRPGVPLDRQERDDLLKIRGEFLESEAEHGKLIVHGHTPSVTPEVRSNRIGIDTAAYATNRLTCLVLEKDERRFLYAGGSAAGER